MNQAVKKSTSAFENASAGLFWALRTQPNYRVHLLLATAAIAAGYFLEISYFEWLVVITLIFVGLIIETINTTIEATTDAIDKKWRRDLKIAKDVSAASMLIFAVGAFILAGIIYLPKIFLIISF